MPYNNAPLPPRREPAGTTQLPRNPPISSSLSSPSTSLPSYQPSISVSRVKKMIQIDQDINMCSTNATFVITLATEMFIQYLAEQGHNVVKSERKPRRNIQYRDLSNAVSRLDNLEFLIDVVPKTIPFKEIKDKKVPTKLNGEGQIETGQTTLDGKKMVNGTANVNGGVGGINGVHVIVEGEGEEDPSGQLLREEGGRGKRVSDGSTIADGEEDVEMS